MWARFTGFAAAFLVCVAAWGQPLVDRLPDDAMVYVGWRGADALGDAYQGSHLRAVMQSTDWPSAFNDFVTALMAKAGRGDANVAEATRMAGALGGALWHHESAFYFGGLIAGQQGGPPSPKLALVVRAGADAPALLKHVNNALAKAGNLPFPVKAEAYGDLVAVTTGAWPAFEALLGAHNNTAAAPALKTSATFNAALGQVRKDPASVLYVDAEALVKMADGFLALGAPPERQRDWRHARQLVGLGGLRQLVVAGGFDAKDWSDEAFLGLSNPRQGLTSLLDGGALSDDVLKLVPQDVTMAGAFRLDLAKFVSQARAAAAAADPEWGQQVERVVAQANQLAGIDIERDLLATLGEEWAAYVSPSVGGNGLLGFCSVSRPRDARKLDATLSMLEKRANEAFRQQIHEDNVTIAFKTRQVDGLTLHYLAVPLVTPTWAIADNTLYVGLYPQVVLSAATHARSGEPTLLQNERFLAVRKRLGDNKFSSITFSDLQRTAPEAYSSWLLLSRYAGFADVFGIDSPLMLIPPIDRLMAELAPAGRATWTDDAGYHARSVTPFPGAGALGQDPVATVMTAQPALMASILLPSLNRARETANRVKSASNLRQIGQGMLLYANDHKGAYPATLGDVAATQDVTAEIFVSPSSNTSPPHEVLDKAKLAEWVNENSDFVYLGKGKTSSTPPDVIVVYEKPDIHGGEGFNALFGDGHVEWLAYDQGMKQLAEQEKKDGAK